MLVIQQADDRNHPVFASLSDPTGNNILRDRLCFSQTIAWAGRSQQAAVDFNSDHLIDSADLFRSVDKTDQERGWSYGGRFCLLLLAQTHTAPPSDRAARASISRIKTTKCEPQSFSGKIFVACPPPLDQQSVQRVIMPFGDLRYFQWVVFAFKVARYRATRQPPLIFHFDYCKPNEARTRSRTAPMSTNACSIASRLALSPG